MTTAAVFGTGSWGTAYAAVLADSGTTVRMWGRRQAVVDQINAGSNEDYLPGIPLPAGITATATPAIGAPEVSTTCPVIFAPGLSSAFTFRRSPSRSSSGCRSDGR